MKEYLTPNGAGERLFDHPTPQTKKFKMSQTAIGQAALGYQISLVSVC
jgi:hypothetical protein